MPAVTIIPTRAARPPTGAALQAEAPSAVLNAPADWWEVINNGAVLVQLVNEHDTEEAAFQFATPDQVDGLDVADRSLTLPGGRRSMVLGPWPVRIYGSRLRVMATAAGTKRIVATRCD